MWIGERAFRKYNIHKTKDYGHTKTLENGTIVDNTLWDELK